MWLIFLQTYLYSIQGTTNMACSFSYSVIDAVLYMDTVSGCNLFMDGRMPYNQAIFHGHLSRKKWRPLWFTQAPKSF